MKKIVVLAAALVAGAIAYVLITENSNRDLWDDVQYPVR